ncbi:hypothetical protein, partial [Klebsiella pneumoniae]|uniref:hypothetical protein n=1 Tax=Klebsiella pneumoniae TaxID=573 RepID=UPI003013B6BB
MNKEVEEVYGGVELAEESENTIEQIREESCATELQTQSASAETINKINESDPVTIVNHEAIDFSENKET